MGKNITLTLDGKQVHAIEGDSIWQVAKRNGTLIPHLCHSDRPGFHADGNCRACMVEIDGEKTLAPSCIRKAKEGMVVHSHSARAEKSRNMVMELLLADQPSQDKAHDRDSELWSMASMQNLHKSRFPTSDREQIPLFDDSHVAFRVNLDACIHCNLCVQACREVQVNDVIGMSGRGNDSRIVFDIDDPVGKSTCVACGECVQICPTGALMEVSRLNDGQLGSSDDYDKEVHSVCPYCGVGCQITYKIKDNEIRYVEGADGPANENRLCVKGRFGLDYIKHPHRLKKPLIRRDDAPCKGLNVDPGNPYTHFREASWEEALDRAASDLARLREEHGGRSIAGFGSAKCSNEEAYLFQKLIRTAFNHNNVDHCTRLCHASSVAALMENIGSGAVTASFNEIKNADVAITIGCNPVENHPVAATFFKQFVKSGGKLIVMDPRAHGLRQYASKFLQFRPGADVAMLNAIMHVIVKEKLYNRQYVEEMTEGFSEMAEHLEDYSPERMAPICGIDAELLREVAHIYAKANAAMIFWGMGVTQHVYGTNNARCLISLALMCGHIGRPGTGLHPLRGQNNVQGASDAGLIPIVFPDYNAVGNDKARERFSKLWGGAELASDPGLTVVEIINAINKGDIKGMYMMGENPAMSDPDANYVRRSLAKLEHLVVQDIFLTETANFADVILPATAWPEKCGTATNTNRQIQMGRPAVTAPGEAREDWWIACEIGKRLGLDWNYQHPRDVFAEMKKAMKSLDNISWERLEAENAVTYPCLAPDEPGQAIVFGEGFPRPNKRGKFTPASIVPPAESPNEEYPMVLTTGRQLEHWHTGAMSRRTKVLDAIEPEANASLNPRYLQKIGVEPGEIIQIETRRGAIEIMARADRAVAEDMVFVPFAFVEAAANLMTNPELDPFGKIPELKYSACRVTKARR